MTDAKIKNDKLVDNTIPRDDAIPEETPAATKEVKRRRRLSPDETRILAEIFEQTQKPNAALRSRLAQQLDMSSRAVQIWFQNRRAKLKRDASEAQNSYIFDRNRRLSLHLYDRNENGYYMPDGMDGVARRASYSVGYPMNQNYQPMMNGQNQYTATTGPMNQYSQNNGYGAPNSIPPQNNMPYQNQNVYMGQQQVAHVQPIQEQPIQEGQIMVNNTNSSNYNPQNQQQMYIQYPQGSQIVSKQNNGQQIQQIVNPMNYSNNNMQPPSQTQNNQILPQQQNMGVVNQQIGIVDQQQQQTQQQQTNNYPLTTNADSSATIVQQNNNGLGVTSSGSNIYNQTQQPMSQQVQNFSPRNLPSPPLNNNKQMNSSYNYVNNSTTPATTTGNTQPNNNNQQQNNNSPYMNQNNGSYQQGMVNNQQQNIYGNNEPLSPVSKDNNNAAAAGNSTPINWTSNVVNNDQGINLNMNANVSTPSYNNSTNQINNNNTTPNFNNQNNNSYCYLYPNPNQKQGVVNSYISPVES